MPVPPELPNGLRPRALVIDADDALSRTLGAAHHLKPFDLASLSRMVAGALKPTRG